VIVDDESSALVQIEERTLTWQQTTALLLIEYVVLAILGEFAHTWDRRQDADIGA
jgi:hypothetical protein